jgi:ATP-binding cassette subfamily C protein LapB
MAIAIVVQFSDDQVAVLEQINTSGKLGLRYCGDRGLMSEINKQELMEQVKIAFIMRPIRATWDGRVDNFIQPYKENWLRQAILGDWRLYSHLFIASFLINVLGLAGILFTRQVYDRVIPAESYPTLYVLFIGGINRFWLCFVFSILRAKVVDMMGKRADLRISDRVYGHVLRIKIVTGSIHRYFNSAGKRVRKYTRAHDLYSVNGHS